VPLTVDDIEIPDLQLLRERRQVMVGLRKLKGRYYARVRVPRPGQKPRDRLIALNTEYIREAEIRRSEVRQYEVLIKDGGEFIPSWCNSSGQPEVKQYTLADAISDYLKARRGDGLREGTLGIYCQALNDFGKVVGMRTSVEELTADHVDQFKSRYVDSLGAVTMNIKLRSVKTFLNWLQERGRIEKRPVIKQLNTGKSMPVYLSNDQYNTILKAMDKLTFKDPEDVAHHKRAFHFYRETGCRLSEPFEGNLNGNFLTIRTDTAKGHSERDIYLTSELRQILVEMRDHVMDRYERNRKRAKRKDRKTSLVANIVRDYSTVFRRACRETEIEGRKFHSLRHTTAVRLYLMTGDIYRVMKQLGHSSVTTTEIYSKFDVKRLEQDFPDLVKAKQQKEKEAEKGAEMRNWDTESWETRYVTFA